VKFIIFRYTSLFVILLVSIFFTFFAKSSFYKYKSKMKNKIIVGLSRELKNRSLIGKKEISKSKPKEYKPIVVVIASYNNEKFCEKNVTSVIEQAYPNYRIIYTDDCSSDQTYEKVKSLVKKYNVEKKIQVIRNDHRCLAMQNHFHAVHQCKDEEIVVMLDGDDWFAHDKVLSYINQCYQDPNIWVTYGKAIEHPNYNKVCGIPLSCQMVKGKKVREAPFYYAMPRTFYAGLFKKIKLEDFLYNGKFFPMSCDVAIMMYLVEMSKGHTHCLDEILYIINRSNPINDSKVNTSLQSEIDCYIRSLKSYNPVKSISFDIEIPPYFDIVCFCQEKRDMQFWLELKKQWINFLPELRNIHVILLNKKLPRFPNLINSNILFHKQEDFIKFHHELDIAPYLLVLNEDTRFIKEQRVLETVKNLKRFHSDLFLLDFLNLLSGLPSVELPDHYYASLLKKNLIENFLLKNVKNIPMVIEKTTLNELLLGKYEKKNSMLALYEKEPWIESK